MNHIGEKLCDYCKQEDCPRCLERSKEFCKSMDTIIAGVIVFLWACRVAHDIGVLVEKVRNEQKEKNSNEEEE